MPPITVITGGSRGIGRATALLLAKEGHKVAIVYKSRQAEAAQVLAEIEAMGGTAIALQADIADEAQVVALFAQIDAQLGRVTGLVNNAGILKTQAGLQELTAARIQQVFNTNVVGAFVCAREAAQRMAFKHGGAGGGGVNVSSVAARLGAAHEYVDYAASKGALDTMTRGLAVELAAEGIRVNTVRPGFIYTDMHADGGEPNRVERIKTSLPMQRGGTAAEVAEAIAWLLSDKSSYVTGSFIEAAGGR
ncbi:SDR family oxidoreductase [Vitreoscilla massiliensis]|uniref:SDR family oxidoreductase n=1 Tax=Vitreoscilla massiliensis TaxID=1689272 RepID=UPI00071D13D1|nr:SDR family oxidoreductase [Vitreoscilla massiliensis]